MTKLAAQPPAGFIPADGSQTNNNARSWDWETAGDIIQGDYHGSREVETKNGSRTLHSIVTEDEEVVVWGTAVLNSKLANVVSGQEVWIHRLGKAKSQSGTDYWDYELFVKPIAS